MTGIGIDLSWPYQKNKLSRSWPWCHNVLQGLDDKTVFCCSQSL